ncbi:MAG TPA: hypothetical protein VL985_02530, partial [Stellaceae bacterium]|nr:hypothetical protein [Stellaceae bacterium]
RLTVENGAYWAIARDEEEARFLTALLNSAVVTQSVAPMQPRGASGYRHFDKLPWELPIPEFDRRIELHRELAAAAAEAERVAAAVTLREGTYFTSQRRAIRVALTADGIAARIDALVTRLLNGAS